jgi:hypothetical protein
MYTVYISTRVAACCHDYAHPARVYNNSVHVWFSVCDVSSSDQERYAGEGPNAYANLNSVPLTNTETTVYDSVRTHIA